jgi:hypothetical protein
LKRTIFFKVTKDCSTIYRYLWEKKHTIILIYIFYIIHRTTIWYFICW